MPRQSNDLNDERLFDSAQFRLVNYLIAHYRAEKKAHGEIKRSSSATRKSNANASASSAPRGSVDVGLGRESQVV
jgi:hypothetical protein